MIATSGEDRQWWAGLDNGKFIYVLSLHCFMVLINIPNISMIAFIYLDSDLLVNCPIILSHYFTPWIATLSKVPVAFCKDGINKSHYFCDEQHLELSTVGEF